MPLHDNSILPPAPSGRTGWPWDNRFIDVPNVMGNGRSLPKISIVTPSYNQGQYIEETIRSVLLQGYPNLEYIIIDGGSTDNTVEIIKKYEPWLTYWVREADDGQADAICKGFQKATGKILAWINSDDYYEPNAFKRAAFYFNDKPNLVFVNGDVNIVDVNSQFVRRVFAMHPSHFFAANCGRHGWPQQGCFWRKSTYGQVGGIDPAFTFCMDKDLFIRLVDAGTGRRLPGPPLANFRHHEQAKSSTLTYVAQQETIEIIEKYGNKKWTVHPQVLLGLWWLFRKQAALRMRVEKYFGLEF